jgi:hypothetical protein
MMRRFIAVLALFLLTLLAVACGSQPRYGNAEQFLRDFVSALAAGDLDRCERFYLNTDDFDPAAEGVQPAISRFDTTVRQRFLNACRGAVELLRGKNVTIDSIELNRGEPRAASFLRNVTEHYSKVMVHLKAGETSISLLIEEVFETDGKWRLTTFSTLFDAGTEKLPDLEIRPSTENRETDIPPEGDEEEQVQPSNPR